MVRTFALTVFGLALFALPALAMTNAELQQYINEINAAARQGQTSPQPTTEAPAHPAPAAPKPATSPTPAAQTANTTVSYNGACPIITRRLTLGMRGEDVSALQRFLTGTGDYAYGEITGYFGLVTQQAVQRYQARTGIVSSGTPDSTGYGAVGPTTRESIKNCTTGSEGTSVADQIAALLAQVAQLQAVLARLQGQTDRSCSFNNQSVAHGASVTAHQSSNVSYGSQCVSQTRTCTNGVLSGSYQYAICTVGPTTSCMFNNQTVANGSSVTAYQSSSVPAGQSCVSQQRTCGEGALSGTYQYALCAVSTASSCTQNGVEVAHGASRTFYSRAGVSLGESCSSYAQSRVCTNGAFSGDASYLYGTCAVGSPTSCSFNNQQVLHGNGVTAYQSASVSYGQMCASQQRICTNGTLSGTYMYASCTPVTGASCTFNGRTIPHASSTIAYQASSVPAGQTCVQQLRTCTNGTLSGSYTHAICSVEQPSNEFRPESYGAAADNATDSTVGIQRAIAAAVARGPGSKVIFSAGAYRVSCTPGQGANSQFCFDIQGTRDLSIEGKGSGSTHIIVTTPTSGLFSLSVTGDIFSESLVRNENIRFTGFSVDYDPLPYTQGTIVAVNSPNSVDVRLDTGMPLPTSASFAPQLRSYARPFSMLIGPSSPKLKLTVDTAFFPTPALLSGDVWRYTDTSGKLASQAAVGDRLVQQGGRAASDVFTIYETKDVTIRDVTIYASANLGVAVWESYGLVRLDGVQVRIKPGTNRLLSANSNATMWRSNRAQPIIENGYFEGNGDDVIDIGANGQLVKSVLSDTRFAIEASWLPARVGDLLQVISPCGALRGEAVISAIALNQQTNNYDVMLATPIPDMRSSGGTTTCTVSGTSSLAPYDSDLVINVDTSGQNAIIRNNTFTFARGVVLINSIGTRIEGNRFTNYDKPIRIGYNPAWRRGPLSRNITIDNNDFANTNAKWPIYIGFHLAGEMPISNITISNNRFRNAQSSTITIDGARDVTLRDNSIVNDTNWPSEFTGNVMIDHANGIVINGLTITDMRKPRMTGLFLGSNIPIGNSGVTVSNFSTNLDSSTPAILDRRGQ